jgi:hypothetical protein
MSRSLRSAIVTGAAILFSGACSDSTGPGAEPLVSVDQIVAGTVEGPGRTAVFSMDGTQGQTLRVFFQATSGDGRDSLVLQLLSPDGASVLTRVTSAGSQPTLEQRAGALFTIPAAGRYRIEVRGMDTGTDEGPFRFRIAPIDPRPEVAAATVAIGATVTGESIATPGDVDEFTFEGSGGDELVMFIQGMSGPRADSLTLTISTPQLLSFQRVAFTPATADSLRAHGTGRFVLPTSGTYVVRVMGRRSAITMGYRLELIRVARMPEHAAQLIAVGTITEESIDYQGDLDEFDLDAAEGDRFTIRFERLGGSQGRPYLVELIGPGGSTVVSFYRYVGDTGAWTYTQPTGTLRAGRYRFRVFGDGFGTDPDPGAYRFLVERAP